MGGVEHSYNVEGTRILSESWGTHLLVYLYDDSGLPTGMQYRNESYAEGVFDTFWFEKNLQGDVVAIYNNAGVKLASYIYDAWGNFTVTYTNGGATTAAQYNPFTYRSYYYDDDLGLYYLNSRYYDSNTGRFINADGQLNDSLLGYNLFAYCGNNPVNYIDPTGEIAFLATVFIATMIAGPVFIAVDSCFDNAGEVSFSEALYDSSTDPLLKRRPLQNKMFWVDGGISEKNSSGEISIGIIEGYYPKENSEIGFGVGKASANLGLNPLEGAGAGAEISGIYIYGEKKITVFGKEMIIGAEAKLASWGASAYIGRKTGFSFSFFAGFGFYIEFV